METMGYRRDFTPGATQAEQPFKPGGELYYYQVFDDELPTGWYDHPDSIPEKKKPDPKPKAKSDDNRD